MAAPHVAGVAALIKAQNPSLSATAIKSQILNTVDVLASLAGKTSTSGRMNAHKALGAAEFPPDSVAPAAVLDLASASAAPDSVSLTWTAPGDDGNAGAAYYYDLRYRTDGPVTEANWASSFQVQAEPNPQPAGSAEGLILTGLEQATTYYFALTSVDEAGNRRRSREWTPPVLTRSDPSR
jgi:subtilisin family serine protease